MRRKRVSLCSRSSDCGVRRSVRLVLAARHHPIVLSTANSSACHRGARCSLVGRSHPPGRLLQQHHWSVCGTGRHLCVLLCHVLTRRHRRDAVVSDGVVWCAGVAQLAADPIACDAGGRRRPARADQQTRPRSDEDAERRGACVLCDDDSVPDQSDLQCVDELDGVVEGCGASGAGVAGGVHRQSAAELHVLLCAVLR